ncbi:hypothetical protein KSF73_08020 [Burkholderiaceae bacterium DAT-1]|nr:hypothetical protein [Burkholderiaceae bacterium DAT-1]
MLDAGADPGSRVRTALLKAVALRTAASADPLRWARRERLRLWQCERLVADHVDLVASERYGPAARFFLEELYGPKDARQRDADVERVLPAMVRLLPDRALNVLAEALELDALSESLDLDMVDSLGPHLDGETRFDGTRWCEAYRTVGRFEDRAQQIALVGAIGQTLDSLSQHPAIGRVLSAMRLPARLAGFSTLHAFLERGFQTFAAMQGAGPFLDAILGGETRLMQQVVAGNNWPFVTDTTVRCRN